VDETTRVRIRWTIALGLGAVAIVFIIGLVRQLPMRPDLSAYRDFYGYYYPALHLRQGLNPYKLEPRWADTPTWFLCFEPLTHLSPFAAYWAWFALNAACFAASLWMLARDAGLPREEAWIAGALLLMYPPVAKNFYLAQSEVLLLFLFVLLIRELQRGRQVSAGLILAAASLLRAYPVGLLGYFVARRKWRALEAALVGLAAGLAATIVLAGPDVVGSFMANTGLMRGAGLWGAVQPLNQETGLLRHPANLNFGAFVKFALEHAFKLEQSSPLAGGIAALAELALLAAVFIRTARFAAAEDSYWRAFSLWVIAISMLSPIMWGQFMVCFVIAYVGIAGAAVRGEAAPWVEWSAAASYAVLVAFADLGGYPFGWAQAIERIVAPYPHLAHVIGEAPTTSLLLLLLAAWWFAGDRTGAELAADRDLRRQLSMEEA
jgi:Glycosyltransferase family 87